MDEPSSHEGNAITLRIKFKSASLDEFVARYGADVSAGGIFIRTKQPLAVGTALHFDFTLGDGAPLIAGMGTVVWVREADASRVGSVPGMGVRFDQLTPDGQQNHQKILVAKAKRQERASGVSTSASPSPSPSPPAAVPAPRPSMPPQPAARPRTPAPPAAVRPSASAPAVPSENTDDSLDDFGGGGKTEIADRPPNFYFESLGVKPAGTSPAKPVSGSAVPSMPLDDAETDSQQVGHRRSGAVAQPVDLGEASGGLSAPVEFLSADSKGNELAGESSPSITDLPLAIDEMSAPASSRDGAVPLTVGKESSWLDDALKATSDESAVPEEAPSEPTQETSVAPDITIPETRALQDETAAAASDERAVEGDLSESPTEDHESRSGKSGKKLIIVGSIAACAAFAGVYLWMAKPWESRPPRSEITQSAPVVPTEPAATPPAAQLPAPPVQPVVAGPAKAAEPVKPSERTKPAAVAQAKPSEPATEPAKAEPSNELAKRSGAGKRASAKPVVAAPTAPPSAPAPAPAPAPAAVGKPAARPAAGAELIYFVKVKSVPMGAHITMDGDPMGTTPFQRRILDIDKSHSILVSKPGYDSYQRTITKADFGSPSGNTSTLSISARLTKLKSPSGVSAPAAAEQDEPAPEQPEKL